MPFVADKPDVVAFVHYAVGFGVLKCPVGVLNRYKHSGVLSAQVDVGDFLAVQRRVSRQQHTREFNVDIFVGVCRAGVCLLYRLKQMLYLLVGSDHTESVAREDSCRAAGNRNCTVATLDACHVYTEEVADV